MFSSDYGPPPDEDDEYFEEEDEYFDEDNRYFDIDCDSLYNIPYELKETVRWNQTDKVKELINGLSSSDPKWYELQMLYGYPRYNLLQWAITNESKEVFDYLLTLTETIPDTVQADVLKTEALSTVINEVIDNSRRPNEYYAIQLIEKGASTNFCDTMEYSLLHTALRKHCLQLAQLLIERGFDINKQNYQGYTPFHMCFMEDVFNSEAIDESVSMLMYFGADAHIRDSHGCIPFDLNFKCKMDDEIREAFFLYTFDKFSRYRIDLYCLLSDTKDISFFDQLLDSIAGVDLHTDDPDYEYLCESLVSMKPNNLRRLIEKFGSLVKNLLLNGFVYIHVDELQTYLDGFEVLIESSLESQTIQLISKTAANDVIGRLVAYWSESVATEFICYLMSYGMKINRYSLDLVYNRFGFCELLNICLHMDVQERNFNKENFMPRRRTCNIKKHVLSRFIFDFDIDLYDVLDNLDSCTRKDLRQLLDFSALPKLQEFCLATGKRNLVKKVERMPQVPLLVELARNEFRRYFIKTFGIGSAKQFYSLVRLLPICKTHEDIIKYATKLY